MTSATQLITEGTSSCLYIPMYSVIQIAYFFSTKYGIYEPNCGLDKVTMSWGHDEYLYQVLVNHGATIPEEGLAMIRYSCDPLLSNGY